MEEQIGNALTVMIVGMLTVIFILGLVVTSGKVLIGILNKTDFKLNRSDEDRHQGESQEIQKKLIALAVEKWSGSKATAVSIKRIK